MPSTEVYLNVTILHMNVLGRRFDYKKTWPKRLPKLAALIKEQSPDIVSLVECQLSEARELAAKTGYKYVNYLGSSILYSKSFGLRVLKMYNWLHGYPHGALVVEIKHKNGLAFNLAASHLPPFTWRASMRKSQQKILCNLFAGWSDASIICTDANWSKTFEDFVARMGWTSARERAIKRTNYKYRTSNKISSKLFTSGSPIDYAIGKPGKKMPLKFLSYEVVSGVGLSDHNFLKVVAQCGLAPVVPPVVPPTN